MQTRNKKLTALGFLLLIAFPLFLSVVVVVRQKIVQSQRRQRFNTEFIQTITIQSDKVYWVKPGKEILIAGRLFDVKSARISGDKHVLTGFYDHKEDSLVKHIRNIVHQRGNSRTSTNFLIIKFLFYPKYNEASVFSIESNWRSIVRDFPEYTELLTGNPYPAPTPPPKHC